MKKNNLQKICILGSGGHATSCIDLIESTSKFEIIGIISQKNDKNHEKKFLNKYRIIGSDKDYPKMNLSNAEKLEKKIINLPSSAHLLLDEKK